MIHAAPIMKIEAESSPEILHLCTRLQGVSNCNLQYALMLCNDCNQGDSKLKNAYAYMNTTATEK
jgi:hypothetical protein